MSRKYHWQLVLASLVLCVPGSGQTTLREPIGFGAGVRAGGSSFGIELLGPRWFSDSVCLTLSANMVGDETDNLPREAAPPLRYTAIQTIDAWSLKLGAIWYPRPKATWRPYVGGGIGVSFRDWELREQTIEDRVDPDSGQTLPVVIDEERSTDRDTTGIAWASVGVELELSRSWSLFAEGQYDIESDFHNVDRGGCSAFGGIRWRF